MKTILKDGETEIIEHSTYYEYKTLYVKEDKNIRYSFVEMKDVINSYQTKGVPGHVVGLLLQISSMVLFQNLDTEGKVSFANDMDVASFEIRLTRCFKLADEMLTKYYPQYSNVTLTVNV